MKSLLVYETNVLETSEDQSLVWLKQNTEKGR